MRILRAFFNWLMVVVAGFAPIGRLSAADVWSDAWNEVSSVGIEAGYNTAYRSGSLQVFIARIIAQLLTFLGIIFFILILYAGFLWMTAGGNEENIGKAKRILTSAGIGLAIVVLAYAITVFVMRAFLSGAGLDTLNP